jgi:hypothetical protein
MPEQPKTIELGHEGFYTLPIVREFVDIFPSKGDEAARFRFRLGTEIGPAITLDVPLSALSLAALRLHFTKQSAR